MSKRIRRKRISREDLSGVARARISGVGHRTSGFHKPEGTRTSQTHFCEVLSILYFVVHLTRHKLSLLLLSQRYYTTIKRCFTNLIGRAAFQDCLYLAEWHWDVSVCMCLCVWVSRRSFVFTTSNSTSSFETVTTVELTTL